MKRDCSTALPPPSSVSFLTHASASFPVVAQSLQATSGSRGSRAYGHRHRRRSPCARDRRNLVRPPRGGAAASIRGRVEGEEATQVFTEIEREKRSHVEETRLPCWHHRGMYVSTAALPCRSKTKQGAGAAQSGAPICGQATGGMATGSDEIARVWRSCVFIASRSWLFQLLLLSYCNLAPP